MMPGAARHVLVKVVIAGGEDVESCARLIGNDDGVGISKLLTIPRVHHGRVQGAAPHVHGVPARPRPGAGDSRRENKVFSCGECHGSIDSDYSALFAVRKFFVAAPLSIGDYKLVVSSCHGGSEGWRFHKK